ncbi:MAG: NYN domain-containing protein [Armatimonadota bacterium]
MAQRNIEIAQELMPHIPSIIDRIDSRHLAGFLKNHDRLASKLLAGFRVNAQNLKIPIVRQRMISEAEHDNKFLELLCGILLESYQKLLEFITFGTVKEIRASLDDLIQQNGALVVKVALLMDDRSNVKRLALKINDITAGNAQVPEVKPIDAEPIVEPEPKETVSSDQDVPEKVKETNQETRKKIKQLEHQIRELEQALQNEKSEICRKNAEISTVKNELASQKKALISAGNQFDRLSRSTEVVRGEKLKLEHELKTANKDVKQLLAVIESGKKAKPTVEKPVVSDWVPVIALMIKNNNIAAARCFCEALRDMLPDTVHPHMQLMDIYSRDGENTKLVDECIWIARYFFDRGNSLKSLAFICNALEVDPDCDKTHAMLRQVIAGTDLTNANTIEKMKKLLLKLKLKKHAAYRQAQRVIDRLGRQYQKAFDDKAEVLHQDRSITFDDGTRSKQLSIRDIINAVETNDTDLVEFLRRAFARMKTKDQKLYVNIKRTLAEIDESCIHVLSNECSPVIVDGSNVAWHECGCKPKLQNIISIRNELRSTGYFPVYIYADAALTYQIDHVVEFQGMVDRGSVLCADGRSDADELIVSRAKIICCPVLTNDHMTDWDPEGEVDKLCFVINRFGVEIHESRYNR